MKFCACEVAVVLSCTGHRKGEVEMPTSGIRKAGTPGRMCTESQIARRLGGELKVTADRVGDSC